jgi:DNA-binding helix-hairpin-helix protein with protein kinase domain
MRLYTGQGSAVDLITTERVGGEGEIFRNRNKVDECAKIFHPSKITDELQEKIVSMVKNPPTDPTLAKFNHRSIAWPTALLFKDSARTQFTGYLMPFIDTDSFQSSFKYYSPSERKKRFGGAFTWRHLFTSAFNITSACHALHQKGHCIGDMRETNIFISPESLVTFLDTDSFQVLDNLTKKIYYCRVGTPEYLPPEMMNIDFKNRNVDRYHTDLFALGIIIFKLLMNGFHPYSSRGPLVEDAPEQSDKTIRGYFAFEGNINGVLPPVTAPPYELVIPPEIRDLFHRCFVTGHTNPSLRPTAQEWFNVLKQGV